MWLSLDAARRGGKSAPLCGLRNCVLESSTHQELKEQEPQPMIGDPSPHDWPHDVELGLEPAEPACGYCDDRGCSECDPEPDPEPDPEAA
jgi:hypothetical protein